MAVKALNQESISRENMRGLPRGKHLILNAMDLCCPVG